MNRQETLSRLAPELAKQLDELAAANHTGAGTVTKLIGRTELRSRLASVDRLACEIESIHAVHPQCSQKTEAQMRELADGLSEQLSYLEERLVILEIDRVTPEVQLRSDQPRTDGSRRSYYEVRVGKGGIALLRFRKETKKPRQSIAATLTRDVFCRVCSDMVAILEQ